MNWEISTRSRSCTGCDKTFIPGDSYKTALFKESEELPLQEQSGKEIPKPAGSQKNPLVEGAARIDFCPECWEKQQAELRYDYKWLGFFKEKSDAVKPKLDLSREGLFKTMDQLLERIATNPDEESALTDRGVAYLLALMMERKRWISHAKDVESEKDGSRQAVYENTRTKETFQIPYPLLTSEWLRKYEAALAVLMHWPAGTSADTAEGGTEESQKNSAAAIEAEVDSAAPQT